MADVPPSERRDAMNSIAIHAHSMGADLGSTPVLQDINLMVSRGRWTSVVGPNGAGKSTLLKVLAGLLPHSGEVTLLGASLNVMPARRRAQQLAWLGQNESTADDLTVLDVAMLGRLPHQSWLAIASDRDRTAVELSLRSTQAWDWRDRPFGQLSGGERQRVLLARVLAVQASVVLMDEPLTNLDPPHQADWLQLVRALVAQGKTVLSVLHELSMALHADEVIVMEKGRVRHQGACSDAQTHAALIEVFNHRIQIVPVQGQWVALPK
jgi:iron complex transport system ATP-binding protein